MCRLYLQAYKKPDYSNLKTLVEAFIESSRYDPYLAKMIADRAVVSHDDGWGLVIIGLVDGLPTVAHYKSVEPIFYENSRRIVDLYLKRASSYDEVYIVIHARKASRREPYGEEYAHPYMMMSDVGVAWFVHNGGADKKLLAEKLGVYPWVRVDSELLGFYIMDHVLSCIGGGRDVDECAVEAYMEAKYYVIRNSALNTALVVLYESEPHLYTTHWVREPRTLAHQEYYKIVSYIDATMSFAGSISIKEYLSEDYTKNLAVLEQGVYKLRPGSIKKLSEL